MASRTLSDPVNRRKTTDSSVSPVPVTQVLTVNPLFLLRIFSPSFCSMLYFFLQGAPRPVSSSARYTAQNHADLRTVPVSWPTDIPRNMLT
jgi:hypothetical protein